MAVEVKVQGRINIFDSPEGQIAKLTPKSLVFQEIISFTPGENGGQLIENEGMGIKGLLNMHIKKEVKKLEPQKLDISTFKMTDELRCFGFDIKDNKFGIGAGTIYAVGDYQAVNEQIADCEAFHDKMRMDFTLALVHAGLNLWPILYLGTLSG